MGCIPVYSYHHPHPSCRQARIVYTSRSLAGACHQPKGRTSCSPRGVRVAFVVFGVVRSCLKGLQCALFTSTMCKVRKNRGILRLSSQPPRGEIPRGVRLQLDDRTSNQNERYAWFHSFTDVPSTRSTNIPSTLSTYWYLEYQVLNA